MMQVAVLRPQDGPVRRAQADDRVGDWFEPLLAERLAEAGLTTLAALVQRIEAAGARWWYPVRGLGATKAARIGDWLHGQGVATGAEGPAVGATAPAGEGPAHGRARPQNADLTHAPTLPWPSRSTTPPSPFSFTA